MLAVGTIPFSSDYRQQIIFLHNSQNGFRVFMYAVTFEPNMHSAISVCFTTRILTFSYFFGKRQILCRKLHSFDIVIVAASRYIEEPTHLSDSIFVFMVIDHHIFYVCSRFLSVSERKSRSNSFSIFKRLFSYLYSGNVFAGLRPRNLGTP